MSWLLSMAVQSFQTFRFWGGCGQCCDESSTWKMQCRRKRGCKCQRLNLKHPRKGEVLLLANFFSRLFVSSLHLSYFCQGYGEPCHLCEFQQAPDVHSLKWCTSDFSKSDCEFSEGFHHAADLSLLMPQQMAMAVEKVQVALFESMFCSNPGASVHPIYCSISMLKDAAGGYAAVQQLCNCNFSLQLHRCCDALSSTGCTWLGSSVLPSWFAHQIRLDKKPKKALKNCMIKSDQYG